MGGGIEGRVGFYASFRAIQWKDAGKLALNVDSKKEVMWIWIPSLIQWII